MTLDGLRTLLRQRLDDRFDPPRPVTASLVASPQQVEGEACDTTFGGSKIAKSASAALSKTLGEIERKQAEPAADLACSTAPPPGPRHRQNDRPGRDLFNAQKAVCRDSGLHLLWCFANADGEFDRREREAILDYCTGCLALVGLAPTFTQRKRLARYVESLRPTDAALDLAIHKLSRADEATFERFLRGSIAVAEASGAIHPAKIQAVNTICRELTGEDLL